MDLPWAKVETAPSARGPFAAVDLGTNNCRLLIAEPAGRGLRPVGAYSEIVRLGEGMAATGRLADAAMARALKALGECAHRIKEAGARQVRCIATQACRAAGNGAEFLERVRRETGLRLETISPQEEAQLAALGCAALVDEADEAALILDIGGGSTELSWVQPARMNGDFGRFRVEAWASLPIGVVTLAEHGMENAETTQGFAAMVERVASAVRAAGDVGGMSPAFQDGRAHLVGAAGTMTSLAGAFLGLDRYQRGRVDGLWMRLHEARATIEKLRALGPQGRAAHPCIGPGRADLVLPGAAILEGVVRLWPCERIRVADRGLREGVLLTMMNDG